jgi:Uma2 family endonuclease
MTRASDVYAIRHDRLPDGELPVGHLSIAPELCVEVLSPSDRWPDVLSKVSELLRVGVHEMWVIDPTRRHVHLFLNDDEPTVLDSGDQLISIALPGLAFAVQELFFLT